MPFEIARADHVAAGRVDVESRAQRDAALDQEIDIVVPRLAAGLDHLVGQPRDPAEARLLVEVVVVVRILHQRIVGEQALEMAVEMRHPAEPQLDRLARGNLRDAALTEMRYRPKLVLVGFVERRRHHFG